MPVILYKTASKQLQTSFHAARQRLSDSFSDRMVSRVSSFDSYSSQGTPHTRESIVPDAIAESQDELTEEHQNKHLGILKGTNNKLGRDDVPHSPRGRKGVSYSQFFETLSPQRISSFFRAKDCESPVPLSHKQGTGKHDSSSTTPSSIAFLFGQIGKRSCDSLMSEDGDFSDGRTKELQFPQLPVLSDTPETESPSKSVLDQEEVKPTMTIP